MAAPSSPSNWVEKMGELQAIVRGNLLETFESRDAWIEALGNPRGVPVAVAATLKKIVCVYR